MFQSSFLPALIAVAIFAATILFLVFKNPSVLLQKQQNLGRNSAKRILKKFAAFAPGAFNFLKLLLVSR